MPTPFPGMDPYLEHPSLWPDVHNSLIAAIRDSISPRLAPRYVVRLEERTYAAEPWGMELIGRPDSVVVERPDGAGFVSESDPLDGGEVVEVLVPDEVRETWLEVRETATGEVVTVLELLSPTNKLPGEGRRKYEAKRLRVLASRTHLVEIDLARTGEPMPFRGGRESRDYRILVSRGDRRPKAILYAFRVTERIPIFELPLRRPEEGIELDLGSILHELYDRARYDLSIDYRSDPIPPFAAGETASWIDEHLRSKALRR